MSGNSQEKQPGSDSAATELMPDELMKYPCQFPLKVFGLNNPEFQQIVIDLISVHCSETTSFQVRKNESKKGKYQSLTITFTAKSRQQLDEIYQSLTDSEHVVMSL